jgi:DNA repair exonuclease SbcCD ATPase subunit
MKPIYLSITDFISHKHSEIDFTKFNSALIIGKVNNNDLISNGVGKTSVFRAIEFCIFNQVRDPILNKDLILDKLIREDANKMQVIHDFAIEDDIYRISRSRTKKGITDLSLFRRNQKDGNAHIPETNKDLWDNISGRRTSDTEQDLTKLIKINYKSFIGTCHFMQNDMSGLATLTSENRRKFLKDVLDLLDYTVLEKMAKKQSEEIVKQIGIKRGILQTINNPQKIIDDIEKRLLILNQDIKKLSDDKLDKKTNHSKLNENYTSLFSCFNVLEAGIASIRLKQINITDTVLKLQRQSQDFLNKKRKIVDEAKELNLEISSLKKNNSSFEEQLIGKSLHLQQAELNRLNEDIKANQIQLGIEKTELESLLIPLPKDSKCGYCRQTLTDAHRQVCTSDIAIQVKEKRTFIYNLELRSKELNVEHRAINAALKAFEDNQKKLNEGLLKLSHKEKELIDKRGFYEEYEKITKEIGINLDSKKKELEQIETEISFSSEKEINELKQKLLSIKVEMSQLSMEQDDITRKLNESTSQKAVLEHSFEESKKNIKQQLVLEKDIKRQEDKYRLYPLVIQAFGHIPDMIIESILEGLQEEANKLLLKIRPDLQLTFLTEKTKTDGTQDDTLQINYFLNNKPRDFSQLSGAQKLCISFSLKLGLSFLLNNLMGNQIKLLLLDETDQSLDDQSIDSLAEIIKLFQDSFTILVITHNKRLKEKFSNIIVVEQDQNMISRAYLEA